MKKVKWTLMTTAIVFSIGLAFAFKPRPHVDCSFSQQYVQVGSGYQPVYDEGVEYVCVQDPGTCTYYEINNQYAACQSGVYIPIPQ